MDCGLSLQQEVGWDRQTIRNVRLLSCSQEAAFLVYSESTLLDQINQWNRMFPRIQPVHEVGYNSLGRVLEGLEKNGVRLHVSAKPQMIALQNLALLNQDTDCVFNAAHKVSSHLRYAHEHGIEQVVFNAPEEIIKIKKNCPNARLLVELNCDEVPNLVEVKKLVLAGLESGLDVVGLHLNLSTREGELQNLEQWMRICRSLVDWSREQGANIDQLHLGQLNATTFAEGFVGELERLVDSIIPAGLGLRLSATVSRFLVTPAVTLAARIIGKRLRAAGACANGQNGGEQMHYYINETVFGAFSSCLYLEDGAVQSPFPLGGAVKAGRKGAGAGKRSSELFETRIYGSSGDELDLVVDEVYLPELEEETWLLFPGLGCLNNQEYTSHANVPGTTSYIYNKPEAVVLDDEKDTSATCSSADNSLGWEEASLCESLEIDLDQYEFYSLCAVLRGDLYRGDTLLFQD